MRYIAERPPPLTVLGPNHSGLKPDQEDILSEMTMIAQYHHRRESVLLVILHTGSVVEGWDITVESSRILVSI